MENNNIPNDFGNIGGKSDYYKETEKKQEQPIYQNVNLGNNGSYGNTAGNTTSANTNTAAKRKTGVFENFIGKNMMGLFASVLVIVGLILLVTAASEYITDTIKVILIYVISFTMLGIGLFASKKSKTGFSMSLAGCGVGAVYISIFMTYGYFQMINVLVMFIMAAVWSVIVFFIGGTGASMFHITGQSGLLISLCYGMAEVFSSNLDEPEIFALALLFFYVCLTVFYAVLDKEGPKWEAVIVFIMNLFGLIFMFATYSRVVDVYDTWQQLVFTSVLLAYSFWLSFISYIKIGRVKAVATDALTGEVLEKKGSSIGWAIYYCFNVIITCVCLNGFCQFSDTPEWLIPLVGLIYAILSWMLVGFLRKKDDAIFIICSVVSLYWAVMWITGLEVVADLFGVGIIILPLLAMAVLLKSRTLMILNVACVLIFSFHDTMFPALYVTLMVLFIASSTLAVFKLEICKEAYYKVALLVATSIFVFRIGNILVDQYDVDKVIAESLAFWIYSILTFVCTRLILSAKKSKIGYDFSLHMIINAMTIISLLVGVHLAYSDPDIVLHIINLLVLLVLVVMNIPDMLKDKNGSNALYCVIKITAFAIVVVDSFDADALFISLICLLVSIVSIIIGFVSERKSVRLYGLILSIISIAKLLLFDISFDSDIIRALVVIGCGIIAFGICLVYNTVSKKLEEEHSSDQ